MQVKLKGNSKSNNYPQCSISELFTTPGYSKGKRIEKDGHINVTSHPVSSSRPSAVPSLQSSGTLIIIICSRYQANIYI